MKHSISKHAGRQVGITNKPRSALGRALAACGVWAAVIGGVLTVVALSPPERSDANLPAGTTSTTLLATAAFDLGDVDSDVDGLADEADPCVNDARNACFGKVAVDAITGNPIRINTGYDSSLTCAQAQLDCNGELWVEDFGYRTPGVLVRCPRRHLDSSCTLGDVDALLGCDDAATRKIFRCGHRGKRRQPLVYDFDLPAGGYLVNLYFASDGARSPARVRATGLTIKLNGETVYSRFDPADVAPSLGAVVVRSALVSVEGDGLHLELRNARKRTALRALEVLAAVDCTGVPGAREDDAGEERTATEDAASVKDNDKDGLVNGVDPCNSDPRNRCVGTIAIDRSNGKPIRVNAGVSSAECSGAKTDCAGNTWQADFGYNQSGQASACNLSGGGEACVISGISSLFGCDSESTEDLFQCDHYDAAGAPELAYSFSLPNGKYVVNLFFANTQITTASMLTRVFDIRVEGTAAYGNFDQVLAAGGSGKAIVRAAVANVSDGNGLQIELGRKIGDPAIKAIEVYAFGSGGCLSPSECNDNNACTTDACSLGTCTHTSNTGTCADDGNACTSDVCSGGACTHPAKTGTCTSDNNPCTNDVCNAGACTHPATTGACTSDNNPCTNDVCNAGVCTHPATTGACDDGLACTFNDVCSGGTCSGTSSCPSGQTCSPSTGQCSGTSGGTDADKDGLSGTADPCPTDPRNRCAGPVAVDSATGKQIRLNANVSSAECSGAKTDCAGDTWQADFGYNQSARANTCDLGGGGESCVITGITALFGCDSESTADLFQCDHWDVSTAPELIYSFSVPNGRYLVNMFFANTYSGTTTVGSRVFDIRIEGATVYDNFDQVAAAGGSAIAVIRSAVANVADGNGLQIEFGHEIENPAVKAIEVLQFPSATCTSASQCSDSNPCTTDTCSSGTCVNTPNTLTCNDGVACTSSDVCSNGVCRGTSNCPSGQTCNTSTGTCGTSQISFGKSTLSGATLVKPTALQFGPDGKLYVAQQDGLLKVFTVTRSGPNSYTVTATQTITSVQSIPNRNDNGALNSSITKRLVTGLLVAGTAANPVLYVTSSDPRIGGGTNSTDTNLDTNSGILSRLTWNGSSWQKLDLVRGLPRSEENHGPNGMALNTATNTLYIAEGGNTNEGATSNNFVYLPEYALSAAILSVNLTAIGNTTYDLPTLNDENRSGSPDANDPFGGNNGKNQAMIVSGGPVQVHSPGWRNPYDVVITKLGKMYSIDNGANAGWGDTPVGNGTSNCTNGAKEPGHSFADNLHLITGPGFYAGHPNPTRGNANNKFNPTNPQSPVPSSNSVECTFKEPGVSDGAMVTFAPSTNGLTEYSASNFGSQMKGDLIAAGWNNQIFRIDLNSTGTAVNNLSVLFSSVAPNSKALDIVAQGDGGPFPGSIWATDYNGGTIIVYEAADSVSCGGQDSTALDDDSDGYSNADEIDNGTSPCSAGDVPPDADADHLSNLNDPDDDNDTLLDNTDPFARDAQNGKTTNLPVVFGWENTDNHGGILNLGFKGLMTNGSSDYEALFNPDDLTASGAAGVLTVDMVAEGDAYQTLNTQKYGFQVGVNVSAASGIFTAHTRIVAPFAGVAPADFQSMGLFIGTGRQDNYVKLTTSANGGAGGIELVKEVSNVVTPGGLVGVTMPGPDAVDLYLVVNPSAATVQAYYTKTTGGVVGPLTAVGSGMSLPPGWLTNATTGLAVGILSTSRGSAPAFAATWDLLEVTPGQP